LEAVFYNLAKSSFSEYMKKECWTQKAVILININISSINIPNRKTNHIFLFDILVVILVGKKRKEFWKKENHA